MSYQAIVTKISVRPHPNADRLQLGTCHGNQVVVGLDIQDGELGVFFPTDGQLSPDFCLNNQLYTASAMAKMGYQYVDDVTASDGRLQYHWKGHGFFDHNRRVRAQRFRGEKSDGFWCPLSYFTWTGYDLSQLIEGSTFTELDGLGICNKYYTPATLRAMQKQGKPGKLAREVVFPEHVDTGQFRYLHNVPDEAVIYITEKLHGTSGRYGHVLERNERPWYSRWLLGKWKADWRHLSGSRRVVLDKRPVETSYYGTNDFREDVVQGITLNKGEVLYFEIVGDVQVGQPIMKVHTVKDELKDLKKQYGTHMHYKYGCLPGEHKMFVYRITQINEDGYEVDLPWTHVEKRCRELGLRTVPALCDPFISINDPSPDVISADEALKNLVEVLTDGHSILDMSHIREGVVVRIESSEGIKYVKNKSWTFGVLEGYIKDTDDYVDLEEAS
jgi:hypothetical protein